MSGRKAKAARQAVRAAVPPEGSTGAPASRWWLSWKGGVIGLAVVTLLGASFVLPERFEQGSSPAASPAAPHGQDATTEGDGLAVGSPVPAFRESDVQTGRAITSTAVAGKKTLLFFSEGVMCQACFEQIRGLEQMGDVLERRGIELVSITPDGRADLEQAIGQYGITTPMISDDDRDMSEAFNTLGQGMHADTPGHAFVLVEKGRVLWQRDYWLSPYKTMYVEPQELLADIPSA